MAFPTRSERRHYSPNRQGGAFFPKRARYSVRHSMGPTGKSWCIPRRFGKYTLLSHLATGAWRMSSWPVS